jgi:hypothetical protein
MFHHLLEQDLENIASTELERAFVEIASGTVNLIWLQEWHDWFHYLPLAARDSAQSRMLRERISRGTHGHRVHESVSSRHDVRTLSGIPG